MCTIVKYAIGKGNIRKCPVLQGNVGDILAVKARFSPGHRLIGKNIQKFWKYYKMHALSCIIVQ